MATADVVLEEKPTPQRLVPPLQSGDNLTRAEFERRYAAMPPGRKAELIDGVVYMSSPVTHAYHGRPDSNMGTWLGVYRAWTPGVDGGDNSTVRLDEDNEPQPDGLLRLPSGLGQSRIDQDGYLEGAPELAAETAASSASYDLHQKLDAYRQHHVREYVVWRVYDREIDWFVLREGEYQRLQPNAAGIYQSTVFPGLWLDAAAMIRGDLARVLQVLQEGLASPEHTAFVADLQRKAAPPSQP